jgi:predicted DNA-binding antitoxin AbrB/MazE fold protein
MSTRIEAIYEGGVLKPLSPLKNIQEHSKVVITVETTSVVDETYGLVQIDPAIAAEIIENPDYSILES